MTQIGSGEGMDNPTIYVVEDDSLVREAILAALGDQHYKVEAYESPLQFLKRNAPLERGCLLFGMYLPGMTGLELHEKIMERGEQIPFILIANDGGVALAVDAIRGGAMDVLDTPIDQERLLESIQMAIAADSACERMERLIEALTPREKEIMSALLTGAHSKKIARQLGVAVKTVYVHQTHILRKMHVDTVAELIARFK